MFRGRYEHFIDAKGRLALPAAFKKELSQLPESDDRLIITTHVSAPCLVAYPIPEWRGFEERLSKLPQFDPSVTMLRRLYVGGAIECALDKHGRVLIPPVLREYAALEKEIYWVGGMKTIEIWSKANWNEVVEKARQSAGQALLERLGELGI